MKVYIAAPLFNETELERNRKVRDFVNGLGFETYLPQEDGGISHEIIDKGGSIKETRAKIFKKDIQEIKNSDIVLCILDGRVPDEGLCIELGVAYTLGKTCIGYLTDCRSFDCYGQNLMIEGCLNTIVSNKEQLKKTLLLL